jgi:hypothetical protein
MSSHHRRHGRGHVGQKLDNSLLPTSAFAIFG